MLEDTSSVCEESKEKDVPDPGEIQQKFRGDAYHMAHAHIGCAANICLLIRCFKFGVKQVKMCRHTLITPAAFQPNAYLIT